MNAGTQISIEIDRLSKMIYGNLFKKQIEKSFKETAFSRFLNFIASIGF